VDPRPRTESEQRAFFETVNECADRALAAAGTVTRTYAVAGIRLRLLFAGPSLVPDLTTALAHLSVPDVGDVDGTVKLFDSDSTGVAMAEAPCERSNFTERGDLWGFNSARYRASFHWGEFAVNVFDRENAIGVYWVQSAGHSPYWVKASPLRSILHWCLELHGRQLVHGAAVGTADGAVLLTGKGGIGKSTTALAALMSGLDYVGDDYVVVGFEDGPTVYSIYRTAKLDMDQVQHFGPLAPCVINPDATAPVKAVLVLEPPFAERLRLSMPLAAIAIPVIEPRQDSVFTPTSSEILKRAASFTTMAQLPYANHQTHAFIERLVAALPGFELRLGRDLVRVPEAIAMLLATRPRTRAAERPAAAPAPRPPLPLVSVVIPTFNGARFLAEAVENVRAQGYPAIEIIVVDDGSFDDTPEVVARLPVDVRYLRQQMNFGASAARNRGIRDSSGAYLAFLDVDDQWPADNLQRLVDHLVAHPDLDLVHGYGQILRFDPRTQRYEFEGNPHESFRFSIDAGLYRRRVFERVGLFDTELKFGEDTDWYRRARELGCRIEALEEVTLHVRRHDQNMTRGKSLVELNTLRVLKRALDRKRAALGSGGIVD
jgi:GT2 family glycosyltransferase